MARWRYTTQRVVASVDSAGLGGGQAARGGVSRRVFIRPAIEPSVLPEECASSEMAARARRTRGQRRIRPSRRRALPPTSSLIGARARGRGHGSLFHGHGAATPGGHEIHNVRYMEEVNRTGCNTAVLSDDGCHGPVQRVDPSPSISRSPGPSGVASVTLEGDHPSDPLFLWMCTVLGSTRTVQRALCGYNLHHGRNKPQPLHGESI